MAAMPYRQRATTALLQAVVERLNRQIVTGVVEAGFTDLRPAHGSVMSQLVHEDGLRTSALATFASMTAQSMGELVDDLERLGYVERRPDPADRRAKLVYLTARGQAAVAASGHAVRAQEAELSRRLGTDGRKRLRDQLLSLLEDSPG
jgi:DNA-binding MarR family transcriptional regulator